MKTVLSTELKKALGSKLLWASLGIGLILCCGDIVENGFKVQEFTQWVEHQLTSGQEGRVGTDHDGYSLFYLWMGLAPETYCSYLFYTIWPVLAAMAYGWSYNEERRSGVYNQIVSRCTVRQYYIAKYLSVFVSGGLAVGLPVLLNLLGNALVCPYEQLSADLGPINGSNFLSGLFYTSCWTYGLVWCGMTFLWGGAAACLCFLAGTKLRYSVIVMLLPYAIYVAVDALVAAVGSTFMNDVNLSLSPLRMAHVVTGFGNPAWFLFAVLSVLIVGSFTVGYWQVTKHELV